MDIRFLHTFIEVASTRHFGKAAENLYLTQSAVSARIKILEEFFHTTLFIRQRNSIQLTPSGEKLLPYARQLTQTLQDAKRDMTEASSDYIVVGATQLASDLILPSVTACLHGQDENRSVKAEIVALDTLSRQLHERVIDIAFSFEPLKSDEVNSQLIKHTTLALFKTQHKPINRAKDFVALDWGSKVKDALLTKHPEFKDAKLRTNAIQLALTSLQATGGYVVLPQNSEQKYRSITDLNCVESLEQVPISLFMHTMKITKRAGVSEAIEHISTNL